MRVLHEILLAFLDLEASYERQTWARLAWRSSQGLEVELPTQFTPPWDGRWVASRQAMLV